VTEKSSRTAIGRFLPSSIERFCTPHLSGKQLYAQFNLQQYKGRQPVNTKAEGFAPIPNIIGNWVMLASHSFWKGKIMVVLVVQESNALPHQDTTIVVW